MKAREDWFNDINKVNYGEKKLGLSGKSKLELRKLLEVEQLGNPLAMEELNQLK